MAHRSLISQDPDGRHVPLPPAASDRYPSERMAETAPRRRAPTTRPGPARRSDDRQNPAGTYDRASRRGVASTRADLAHWTWSATPLIDLRGRSGSQSSTMTSAMVERCSPPYELPNLPADWCHRSPSRRAGRQSSSVSGWRLQPRYQGERGGQHGSGLVGSPQAWPASSIVCSRSAMSTFLTM